MKKFMVCAVMVLLFPRLAISDYSWNNASSSVWDIARVADATAENVWTRAEFVEVVKSGCPCGCGCSDCGPGKPCDCGCPCGLSVSFPEKDEYGNVYKLESGKWKCYNINGQVFTWNGKEWKLPVSQVIVQQTQACSS